MLQMGDKCSEAHEEFIGLYAVGCTEASVLVKVIDDVLTRVNISIPKLRGKCCDGASSMSGSRSGAATIILENTHCYGHSLNLACSDTVKECKLMRNALYIVHEITKFSEKVPTS